jgi:hypothetical protein
MGNITIPEVLLLRTQWGFFSVRLPLQGMTLPQEIFLTSVPEPFLKKYSFKNVFQVPKLVIILFGRNYLQTINLTDYVRLRKKVYKKCRNFSCVHVYPNIFSRNSKGTRKGRAIAQAVSR